MADLVRHPQHEFWSPPRVLDPTATASPSVVANVDMANTCARCGREFMIGARFCHSCGLRRGEAAAVSVEQNRDAEVIASLLTRNVERVRSGMRWAADTWREIPFPDWLHYLHFHEIKRWVGLPTGALIAFIMGLGCMIGVLGVSLFYKASNLAEFQAIQMWRIEWLLAATASFVAGILLKKPSE